MLDISSPDFPGIHTLDGGYIGPRPTPALHPHLRLEETMTAPPKVYPGDAIFWHCDVIHAVEEEHNGPGDSAGLGQSMDSFGMLMIIFFSDIHPRRSANTAESVIHRTTERRLLIWSTPV